VLGNQFIVNVSVGWSATRRDEPAADRCHSVIGRGP
jgi:hypothetical protein